MSAQTAATARGRRAAPTRRRGTRKDAEALTPRYTNRELSWLDFNSRVLAIAADTRLPVLERAKFLAIISQNLDEFFQVRVAGLKEQVGAGLGTTAAADGITAVDQLRLIRARVEGQVAAQDSILNTEVLPALATARIHVVDAGDLNRDDRAWIARLFESRIFPVLTPLAVDPAHPFPYISNLSLNLAVLVRDPQRRVTRFARIKVPPLLPRFVELPDHERFVPLEQVIAMHLDALFPGMKIVAHHPFRVTRNADLELEEDEADDLLAAIESELLKRRRFADVVRLEIDSTMSAEVLDLLTRELEVEADDVYVVQGLIDQTALWAFHALERPDLKEEPWVGVTPARLAPPAAGHRVDFFAAISAGDILIHHPYDSFTTTVEAFIEHAASDPAVLAIKQTLYRTSGPEAGIMRALIRAAEGGKQVVALVELKARGDEQRNIAWARMLEQAGVHVVYGLVGLKTHAKVLLVLRRESAGIRHYVHMATGNYNPGTASAYEDIGLLSCDPDLGADATELFNHLTGYSRQRTWRRLVVAPGSMRGAVIDLIRREAASPDGRIVMKMNSLVDQDIIDALYAASAAGADIDLIVRGICCIRPGVPGLSENIRVRSLVGRYLEHSRIYRFGSDARGAEYLVGSADMMPRNLDRRVEVLVPMDDATMRDRLREIQEICLADDVLAWELRDDSWTKVPTGLGVNAQRELQRLALQRSRAVARALDA